MGWPLLLDPKASICPDGPEGHASFLHVKQGCKMCTVKKGESKSPALIAEDSLCEPRQCYSIILFVLGRLTDSPVEIQGSLKAFNCLTKICHAI